MPKPPYLINSSNASLKDFVEILAAILEVFFYNFIVPCTYIHIYISHCTEKLVYSYNKDNNIWHVNILLKVYSEDIIYNKYGTKQIISLLSITSNVQCVLTVITLI